MRKQLVFTFSAILVVAILTVGFSSKAESTPVFEITSGEKSTLLAAQGLTAVKEVVSFGEKQTPSAGEETFAVEIKEGGSTSFRGLSITLLEVQKKASCARDCLEAQIQLSVGADNFITFSRGEGGVFLYEGYQVKVSQIAPEETSGDVSRRAVLLLSGAE